MNKYSITIQLENNLFENHTILALNKQEAINKINKIYPNKKIMEIVWIE